MLNAVRAAVWAAVACLLTSPVARADDSQPSREPHKAVPKFLAEFHELKQGYNDGANAIFAKAVREFDAAETEAEREAVRRSAREQADAIRAPAVQKAFELVKPHAAEAAAAEPLVWLAQSGGDCDVGPAAAEMLIEHHLTRVPTLDLAYGMKHSDRNWVEPMLRAQLAANGLSPEQRAKQKLALATNLRSRAARGKGDSAKLEAEAIELFSELEEASPRVELIPGITVADVARSSLFEIRNLGIGKSAPEIEGEDLDGALFKLSDYRGKVVLLSFWASWCGPCLDLLPHERGLVEQYAGRPFALIGVNCDGEKETLKPWLAQNPIPWRSFWAGEKGPAGPIPRAWNVTGWPTVYLIDHAGIVRAKKHADAAELDAMIEASVAAAERALKAR
ncbi:MAG TPA: TlpA disulfide reductase family protein [Pirellulales bacterium]|nr:TlpA disulfide reductase family protein [Pirellulales bacterium]